jgi:hypothetical protein
MLILGISGRKQSGKSTIGNFILSLYLAKLGYCEKIYMDEDGQLLISDILGDTRYEGVFDIRKLADTYNDPRFIQAMNKLNSKVKIYNFADILKTDICINMLGLTYDQCYGTDDNKNEMTNIVWNDKKLSARDVMQVVGTDIFRKLDTNVWVRSTINKIIRDKPDLAVITDCRFPNEVDSIKQSGGKVIRLTRNPFQSDHLSETVLDKDNYDWSNFDYVVENSDITLLDQFTQIKKLLEEILPL